MSLQCWVRALCAFLVAGTARGVLSQLSVPCGTVLHPSDAGFANATAVDNGGAAKLRQPAIVVRARCVDDIPAAMQYAQRNKLGFAVKGGGHSAAGYALIAGGVVVDMSLMNASRVRAEPATGEPVLWVEAGAIFEQVYARLDKTNLILAGGGCSSVGLAGFMLGGGLSFLSRAFGLGSDNLLSMTLVAANGTVLRLSSTDPAVADLWWAVRGGGGGNFGVVVDMTVRLHAGEDATDMREVCWQGTEAAIFALPRYAGWLDSDAADPRVGVREGACVCACVCVSMRPRVLAY